MTFDSGVVRGESIHMACATQEEVHLTWARFYGEFNPPPENVQCERCGNFLDEEPGQLPEAVA
jgi:hypothetical protein